MTYELEKQLKKAGFRFRKWSAGELPQQIIWEGDNEEISEEPTLSELIEACGEHFFELQRLPNGEFVATHNPSATGYAGKTPEEAVAYLWLELKKRDND